MKSRPLSPTFWRFDADNSGFITVDNLREILGETLGSEDQAARILAEVPQFSGFEGKVKQTFGVMFFFFFFFKGVFFKQVCFFLRYLLACFSFWGFGNQ